MNRSFRAALEQVVWEKANLFQRRHDAEVHRWLQEALDRFYDSPLNRSAHLRACPMWRALGAAAVECEHGVDVCPKCDPCNCRPPRELPSKLPVRLSSKPSTEPGP